MDEQERAAIVESLLVELRAELSRSEALARPASTYRLQLHREFGFERAAEIVPYLHALGVTHVYLSPEERDGDVLPLERCFESFPVALLWKADART